MAIKPTPRVPSKKTGGDHLHLAAKAAVSMIPLLGGPAAEVFAALIQPPLEKRRDEWMHSVSEVLKELSERGIDIDELRKDENFIDTVFQTTQIALRNHQASKREALRNAIRNTGLDREPNELLRHIFLQYVDLFSPEHLLILQLFSNPPAWFARNSRPFPNYSMGGLSSVLEDALPVFRGQRGIYDQVWRDLYSRGLVTTEGLHTTMSGHGLQASRTSELGNAFLAFIGD